METKNMKDLGEGAFEFETKGIEDYDENNEEDDDDVEDMAKSLEREAEDMVRSWDRETLLKEIAQERDLILRNKNKQTQELDYYDGQTKFDELVKDMKPLEGGQVFIRKIEEKPEAKQIEGRDSVLFDRIGYLESNPLPFECSIYDGKPTKVNLIEGPILPGLLLALLEMREGERADVMIKPSMGFGALGSPPIVPANAQLYYNLKVYKVWTESLLDSVIQFEHNELIEFPLAKKISLIESHKDAANKFLHDGYARDALIRYKSAIKYIDELGQINDPNHATAIKKLLITLLVNSAVTLNKLEMPKSASKMAKRALNIESENLKAYYQFIKARIALADYEEAFRWLERALKLVPSNDRQFDQLKLELDSKITSGDAERRELYRRMARGFCQSSS